MYDIIAHDLIAFCVNSCSSPVGISPGCAEALHLNHVCTRGYSTNTWVWAQVWGFKNSTAICYLGNPDISIHNLLTGHQQIVAIAMSLVVTALV